MGKYDVPTPEEKQSPMAKSVEAAERVEKSLAARARGSIEIILLVFIVFLEITMNFIGFALKNTLTPSDVIFIVTECLTTVLVFYLFILPGKHGRKALPSFREIQNAWEEACKRLRDNFKLVAFRQYCQDMTASEIEELRRTRMERLENLYVTKEDFEALKKKSKKELRALVKRRVISRAAYRQILVCRSEIKVKPYQADLILTGATTQSAKKGLNGSDNYEALRVSLQPVLCIALALIPSIIGIVEKEILSPLTVIASIAVTCLRICVAAYGGYKLGWQVADREEGFIRARTNYIETFEEKEKN